MIGQGQERKRVLHPTGGESRVKQADADSANINSILKLWLKTGIPPQTAKVARYGDFSTAEDYLTCMLKVSEAQAEFAMLPALVRKACDNNPGKFLELVSDPERREELVELGLVEKQVPVQVDQVKAPEAPDPVPEDEGSPAPEVPEKPQDGA